MYGPQGSLPSESNLVTIKLHFSGNVRQIKQLFWFYLFLILVKIEPFFLQALTLDFRLTLKKEKKIMSNHEIFIYIHTEVCLCRTEICMN